VVIPVIYALVKRREMLGSRAQAVAAGWPEAPR
jgi:hypothetical protein